MLMCFVMSTVFATWWIRKRVTAATAEIEAERAGQIKGVPPMENGHIKTGAYGRPAYENGTA